MDASDKDHRDRLTKPLPLTPNLPSASDPEDDDPSTLNMDKDAYIPWPKKNLIDATDAVWANSGWERSETYKTKSQKD
jgi:hypothetical protein